MSLFQQPAERWWQSQAPWQFAVLLLVWMYLCALQWDNDGLWYRGDAARHALNGFFWSDYLRDFTWDAKGYALSYYARYPAIDPASRPPFLYLLQGVAFTLIGPSPYAAKAVVLCFALLAAIYLWAWLRRWIGNEAAWAAPLFLLLPGTVRWSHAIMPHVPALALSLGALYHGRAWLEASSARRRDFWYAALFSLVATLTYYPAALVVLIIVCWAAFTRSWYGLLTRQNLVPTTVFAVVLIPFAWLVVHWAPTPLSWVIPDWSKLGTLANWTYYFGELKHICNPYLIVLAAVGAAANLTSRAWRRDTMLFVVWILAMYAVLSLVAAKDLRYALLVTVPLLGLAVIAIVRLGEWLGARRSGVHAARATAAMCCGLLVLQIYLAAHYRTLSVSGYREVVSFLSHVAPAEPVLFDGFYDGVFTFYVRAGDPEFRRRVVLGHKLLYTYAMFPGWRQQEFASSPEEVVDILRRRGGTQWLAVEMGTETESIAPMRYLREAVKTPAFELVRSFPVSAYQTERVDVYRLKLPVREIDEVELPFAVLGEGTTYRVRPIRSRRAINTLTQVNPDGGNGDSTFDGPFRSWERAEGRTLQPPAVPTAYAQ